MPTIRSCISALLIGHVVAGQQILVVDPLGGGQFLSVAAALLAAGPGDTVFVRGGTYGGLHVVPGPLHIVGDPALPRPSIASLQVDAGSGGGVSIVNVNLGVATILASAAFDQVEMSQFLVQAGSVVMTRCSSFYYTSSVQGGDVVLNDCSLTGRPATYQQTLFSCTTYPAQPALEVTGGQVTIANCVVSGGSAGALCVGGTVPGVPSTSLRIGGGSVRATRSTFVGGGAGGAPLTPAVIVQGGSLAVDPSTTFTGAGQPSVTSIFLPATDGRSAAGGGAITATLQATPGLAALLAVSLGRGAPIPSFAGDVWFDVANYAVLAFGVTDAAGLLGASIPVPLGIRSGTAITAQGAAIAPTALAVTATPVVLHVQ